MAETPYTKYRLGEQTLAQLDELTTGGAISRTQALREAVAGWRRLVEEAGQQNAQELAEADWMRLAQLNDPDPFGVIGELPRDEGERAAMPDWSARLAQELVGMWEGRDLRLSMHQEEARACRALARRIAGWGLVRGYALMAALRALWRRQDTPEVWWQPEVWLSRPSQGNG